MTDSQIIALESINDLTNLAFKILKLGLFSVYRILTENYSTAGSVAYSMLEEAEAAYKLGGMKEGRAIKEKHRLSGKKK